MVRHVLTSSGWKLRGTFPLGNFCIGNTNHHDVTALDLTKLCRNLYPSLLGKQSGLPIPLSYVLHWQQAFKFLVSRANLPFDSSLWLLLWITGVTYYHYKGLKILKPRTKSKILSNSSWFRGYTLRPPQPETLIAPGIVSEEPTLSHSLTGEDFTLRDIFILR